MLTNLDIITLKSAFNILRGIKTPEALATAAKIKEMILKAEKRKKAISENSKEYYKTHKEKHRENALKSYHKQKEVLKK